MQIKLEEKKALIVEERKIWEKEKHEIQDLVNLESEVVALNVGGTHHLMTERDVLRAVPGSTLEKMFNGMHELKKINDEVFLDRDGNTFNHLINYLRNKREVFPEFTDPNEEVHFFKELDWWKIPTKQHVSRRTTTNQSLQPRNIPESVKETLYKSEAQPISMK